MGSDAFDIAYKRVKAFFENEVTTFLIADLERMGKIQDHPAGTIPESQAVFSFLDLLGFLMRFDFDDEEGLNWPGMLSGQQDGKPIDRTEQDVVDKISAAATRTGKNISYMASTWLAQVAQEYKEPLNLALLQILFRHGGVHQFFPKVGSIGKDDRKIPVLKVSVTAGKYPVTHLNQNNLREDFLESLKLIKQIIIEKKESDMQAITGESLEKMILRINARLDARLYLDRQQLLEVLTEHAPELLPYCPKPYTPKPFQHISYDMGPEFTKGSGIKS